MNSNYTVMVVDDEDSVRRLLSAVLKREGYQVVCAESGEEALSKFKTVQPDLIIMDIRMPNIDGITAFKEMRKIRQNVTVILMTAYAAVETAVEAIKLGAFDYVIKPFDIEEVKLLTNRAIQLQKMTEKIYVLNQQLIASYRLDKIITNSPKMQELCQDIAKIAQSNASVLITGESGTGKELIANTIHYNSKRNSGPFIKINCGALPESLLDSELFGHEKGAFTGAVMRRPGRFEQADHGTLFLDEIGEISPNLQVKLLRVLQEREFERVGGNKTIKTDIRVLAATNRNLAEMVKQGTFRQDLYYRLNVVCLSAPPLRERREDIELLAGYFLQKFTAENEKDIMGFDPDALKLLENYNWPGNVRELANIVERSVIMSTGSRIFPEDLPDNLKYSNDSDLVSSFGFEKPEGKTLKEMIKKVECMFIKEALQRNQGNKAKTAKELGMSRRSVLYKIQEYEIE
ncbi:sigma 54-interacting transcriptional regulator [Sporomusa malonica]|uniref:Two-component system, NtrC family, response regulator AtoC n=1 Tax=Sporomusa malonica TaxID=112901 RepID=A0A1W2BCQ9_9FIRM|nr:sigma 54-interacting transcriptional regulator [Sporomusa malonica]SMC70767.1 two-component system, NtrC family, response regulator AtoC [Sporomusa malonica]